MRTGRKYKKRLLEGKEIYFRWEFRYVSFFFSVISFNIDLLKNIISRYKRWTTQFIDFNYKSLSEHVELENELEFFIPKGSFIFKANLSKVKKE
jgi:hypothetical protein